VQIEKINSFEVFCEVLQQVGFSMGGSNDEGIFAVSNYFAEHLVEHTGDKETDPWQWRIRGVIETDHLAYGKLFLNKGGWITKDWFPYFMSVRRNGKVFDEMYYDGAISHIAKKIYNLISDTPNLSLHEIKTELGVDKDGKSGFETALTALQMKMLITISGEKFKLSKDGNAYGWPVTTFCTVEEFFGAEVFDLSCKIEPEDAIEKITQQILILNPNASIKSIKKFIGAK
jgi:hypothetical protein